MHASTLQRFVVRMFYDPTLVDAVYDGDPVTGLDPGSRALLTATDRRAWTADPYRQVRSLHALIEEFPVSAAAAGLEPLRGFFSSDAFHQMIMTRGSMALAFGAWVEHLAGPLARIEHAMARVRRADTPEGAGIICAPTVRIVNVADNTISQFNALRARLGPDPVTAISSGAVSPLVPTPFTETMALLIEADAQGQVSVSGASPALAALLLFAERPRAFVEMVAEAGRLGAGPDEDTALVDSLVADGLLTRLGQPEPSS